MPPAPEISNQVDLVIDRRTPAPLYHQICVTLRAAITDGRYPRASTLPSEPALARQLQVCRPTVHAALLTLMRAGIVERGDTGDGVRWTWRVVDRSACTYPGH